ncbi:hypothetical protein KJ662_05635 [Patescibacteria group bacterium]|nr:hypothetical protein [Patescibacteria group bacterium]
MELKWQRSSVEDQMEFVVIVTDADLEKINGSTLSYRLNDSPRLSDRLEYLVEIARALEEIDGDD